MTLIQIRRAYDPPDESDGDRYLVDRVWPRGVKKEALELRGWIKEVAPSDALRKWFGHDPDKWDGFRQRYLAELEEKKAVCGLLLDAATNDTITLVFGARDAERNNAVVLRDYLMAQQTKRALAKETESVVM